MTTLTSQSMIVFLLVVGAALVVFYGVILRKEGSQGQRLTGGQLGMLWGIRIVVAVLALVALARPAREKVEIQKRLPVLPLVVDESMSQDFPAARGNPLVQGYSTDKRTRYNVTREAAEQLQAKLTRTHRVRLYTFSDSLKLLKELPHRTADSDPIVGVDDLFKEHPKPTGSYTNIGDALSDLMRNLAATEKVSGVVLMTDGRQTGGVDLKEITQQAVAAGLPVHTIVTGSEYPLRDLRIDDVIVPVEASLGDVLTFHVKVTNQISASLNVELKLEEADAEEEDPRYKKAATRGLVLPRGQHTVTISTIPEVEGNRRFRLSLPVQPEEVNEENNVTDITVKVVKRTLNVLLIAGEPSREYLYMAPALLRDPIIDLSTYLQSADVDYTQQGNKPKPIERLPASVEDWSKYDVAILFDVDPNGITAQQVNGLEAMVANGGGLMIIAGRTHGLAKLIQVHAARIRGLLPVEVDKNLHLNHDKIYDRAFHCQRTIKGRGHPIMLASTDQATNEEVWKTFDDLNFYWYHPVQEAKPKAITLLEMSESEGGQNACLMAIHRYVEGSVFFSGINSLWRWRYPYESYDYDRLWTRVIRYLGEARLMGTQQQVSLKTDRRTYAPGEDVQIQLRIMDPALFSQLEGQPVFVSVTDENKAKYNVPMHRDPRGENLYLGTYRARRTGTMQLESRQAAPDADSEAKPLFEVKHSFTVKMQSLEHVDTSADQEAMRTLASQTGGKYFDYNNISDLDSLVAAIPTDPHILKEVITEEMWDGWLFVVLFLFLVSAELSLRKWWGLL